MSLQVLLKQGETLLENKDYLEAASVFTQAINGNNNAFTPYLKRAIAYQKLTNYDGAKQDIASAYAIANERGKRVDKATCYYRLALVYYLEKKFKLALYHFEKADELGYQDPALAIWKNKSANDLKAGKAVDEDAEDLQILVEETTVQEKEEQEEVPLQLPSTHPDVIAKHTPLKSKIRDDWYQSNDTITITIYAKNVNKDEFSIHFEPRAVAISFPSGGNSEYNYNLEPLGGEIVAEKSSYRIFGTKVEVYLTKANSTKWKSLEGTATADSEDGKLLYPSSARKAIDWANFAINDEEDAKNDNENFFEKLYKDVDEDTRRAMMKSYVQSNGTVLTTNWDEAKDKEFETKPPDGMEARKWT